jgi:hypothetical protein
MEVPACISPDLQSSSPCERHIYAFDTNKYIYIAEGLPPEECSPDTLHHLDKYTMAKHEQLAAGTQALRKPKGINNLSTIVQKSASHDSPGMSIAKLRLAFNSPPSLSRRLVDIHPTCS